MVNRILSLKLSLDRLCLEHYPIDDSPLTIDVSRNVVYLQPKHASMKKLTAFLLLIAGPTAAFAQSAPTSISYNKKDQPALALELPYSLETSEDFILTNLKRAGYEPETKNGLFGKNSKINGFYTFKGVRLDGMKQPVDLYFKVEQKNRKQTDQSIIYLLVSKETVAFVSSSADKEAYNASRKFLNDFVEQSAAYKLDLDIEDQQYLIKAEEKKLEKLKTEEKNLNKKIEQLQADIKKNREDQQNQQKAVEVEQKKLTDLKTKKSA